MDAVNRVHDADQAPNYRKIKETRPADPADAHKFRSTLEQRRREGDGSAESKTDKLASELQKSLVDRIGGADPSDLPMARETAKVSKDDAPSLTDMRQDKDDFEDGPEADEGVGDKTEAVTSESPAPGEADTGAEPAQPDQMGASAPEASQPPPDANPSTPQPQNAPNLSAQLAQTMQGQPSPGGFDMAGSRHDYQSSESVSVVEQLREKKRDADDIDPADPLGNAAAAQMAPMVRPSGDSDNEVSDAKEAERLRTKERDELRDKLLSDVSKILATFGDNKTQEVTVFLAPEVLPDTSFTVSLKNNQLEVKFHTKNGQVADKINDVRGDLEKRLRGPNGRKVTVPKVSGGDDPDPGI